MPAAARGSQAAARRQEHLGVAGKLLAMRRSVEGNTSKCLLCLIYLDLVQLLHSAIGAPVGTPGNSAMLSCKTCTETS
jgi:hypothetical protein